MASVLASENTKSQGRRDGELAEVLRHGDPSLNPDSYLVKYTCELNLKWPKAIFVSNTLKCIRRPQVKIRSCTGYLYYADYSIGFKTVFSDCNQSNAADIRSQDS